MHLRATKRWDGTWMAFFTCARERSGHGAASAHETQNDAPSATARCTRLRTTLLAPRPMTLNSIMSEAEHYAAVAARVSRRERAQPPSPGR